MEIILIQHRPARKQQLPNLTKFDKMHKAECISKNNMKIQPSPQHLNDRQQISHPSLYNSTPAITSWAVRDRYLYLRTAMKADFVYLSWQDSQRNKHLTYSDDKYGTVGVRTSVGVYKNSYGDLLMERNGCFYWEVKIHKGNYFKIGIIKHSEIHNVKKAFSDLKDGYAYYSTGKLRNGSNSDGNDFKKGYGPGDTVKVKFEPREGRLSFGLNDDALEEAFCLPELKKGGYVAAVGALIEGSCFSFTLPDLQD